jgi:hypothetical protein
MAMSKTTNDIVWSGKTTEWDTFDRQVARWCRKKFANLGSWFWGDSPPELTFELQKKIFKIEKAKDFRSAQSLWESKEFWTLEYLEEWIEDGFSKTFDYVEEHVSGNAEKETVELGLDGIRSLRSRFITGTGTVDLLQPRLRPWRGLMMLDCQSLANNLSKASATWSRNSSSLNR